MLLKVSEVLKKISNGCVILTVIICLVFSVFVIPRLFGISPFVVQSSSMEPAIPTGSVVFVDTKDTEVQEGDIVTYSLSVGGDAAVFVTHRVHKLDESQNLMQTKGDNNDNADGWISLDSVEGTVKTFVPYCGFVLDALQRAGFVVIAIWMFAVNLLLMMVPVVLDALVRRMEDA